jgi:hypothetical protein
MLQSFSRITTIRVIGRVEYKGSRAPRSQDRRLDSDRAPSLWVNTDAEAPRAICTHNPVRLWIAQSGLLETYQSNHSSTLTMQLLCYRIPKRFLPLVTPRASAISNNVAHPLRQPRVYRQITHRRPQTTRFLDICEWLRSMTLVFLHTS